jgi:hypothetical protein
MGALLTLPAVTPLGGQQWTAIEPDPAMPVKDGFDVHRAIFWAEPNFVPLRNPEWIPLEEALGRGTVERDTPVVVFEAGGETLVLVSSQMAYHHVAQGEVAGEPWMVSF